MKRLHGKNILLGITGGIAAYKSAELTRRLKDAGADVRIAMTKAATEFVTPLTFQALSGHPVHTELLDEHAEAGMGHIELARWADAILVAPASANFITKLTQGRADDLLSTLCLATEAPLAFAPAMNQAMWHDLATQANCKTLRQRGLFQFGPAAGEQACGEVGEGRMMEVPDLIDHLANCFEHGELQALNVMITAGPTYEPIDPVRFIGNRSSGRMGYALAEAAREAGASVTLVSGPCHLETPERVQRIDVETAKQMHQVVFAHLPQCDIFIAAAAVADYRPAEARDQKIKKDHESLTLELERNPDILSEVAHSQTRPFVVGFAAETQNLAQHAKDKLQRKNLDMIAANLVGQSDNTKQDIGFNSEYNSLQVFWPDGQTTLETTRKTLLARQLIQLIANHYQQKKNNEKDTA
ncbi:MAG: bifunctional phosphopantothenoylcysteine decarboxylase/phosphopantothenate--cysteine ligase CoaBC [Gammaproteobacteria bacterium]|nr:bifunctional phosphopantothenoylcysteine decarboxylase/phosphopantothenate--cysteine ligase CoaBC [Gammaproteobacteria bacterium]